MTTESTNNLTTLFQIDSSVTALSIIYATLGGILIGSAALIFMLSIGRIAGISGIAASLLSPKTNRLTLPPQISFLLGLIVSGFIASAFFGPITVSVTSNYYLLIAAGLFVGFGTRLGNGCTSGHGVCGISRLSKRSIIATMVFMATAIITLWLSKPLF